MSIIFIVVFHINFFFFNFSWVVKRSDEKIMKIAKICILFHLIFNLYELSMVRLLSLLLIDLNFFLFQIFSGKSPYLTKGPFALFYGGKEIVPLLDTGADNFPIAWVLSGIFNLTLVINKRIQARKLTAQQRLRRAVVGNFLNILGNLVILLLIILLSSAAILHYLIIKENSSKPVESHSSKDPEEYWVNLLLIAAIETTFQLYPFFANPALR